MRPEKTLAAILQAARMCFVSKQKVLQGSTILDTPLRDLESGETVIGQTEMPRVFVVGMALHLGVPRHLLQDVSALDLGETSIQITNNLNALQKKYAKATTMAVNVSDWSEASLKESRKSGVGRFIIKHNLMARKVHELMGNEVLPEFPYLFKREKNEK